MTVTGGATAHCDAAKSSLPLSGRRPPALARAGGSPTRDDLKSYTINNQTRNSTQAAAMSHRGNMIIAHCGQVESQSSPLPLLLLARARPTGSPRAAARAGPPAAARRRPGQQPCRGSCRAIRVSGSESDSDHH